MEVEVAEVMEVAAMAEVIVKVADAAMPALVAAQVFVMVLAGGDVKLPVEEIVKEPH